MGSVSAPTTVGAPTHAEHRALRRAIAQSAPAPAPARRDVAGPPPKLATSPRPHHSADKSRLSSRHPHCSPEARVSTLLTPGRTLPRAMTPFRTWKTWEQGGVPELAVEIASPSDDEGPDWDRTLARYHELGVKELVRFDPTSLDGQRLRVWDCVNEDLVERVIAGDRTPCLSRPQLGRVPRSNGAGRTAPR